MTGTTRSMTRFGTPFGAGPAPQAQAQAVSLAGDQALPQSVLTTVLTITLDVGTWLVAALATASSYGCAFDVATGTGAGTFDDGQASIGGEVQAGYGSICLIGILTVTAAGTFVLEANAGQAGTSVIRSYGGGIATSLKAVPA